MVFNYAKANENCRTTGHNRAQAARLFFRLVDTMQKQISEYKLDEKF